MLIAIQEYHHLHKIHNLQHKIVSGLNLHLQLNLNPKAHNLLICYVKFRLREAQFANNVIMAIIITQISKDARL
jgi:hypothetical protein